MIDAPDHAAQERGNRSAGAWLLVALLGIALSVAAGMMSYGYMTAQAEQRFADVVDYVATQSLSYDAFNSAYTTKNLIRVMEIAGEAARDMERDGSVDNAMLEQYADQFNVSALIVTDAPSARACRGGLTVELLRREPVTLRGRREPIGVLQRG